MTFEEYKNRIDQIKPNHGIDCSLKFIKTYFYVNVCLVIPFIINHLV